MAGRNSTAKNWSIFRYRRMRLRGIRDGVLYQERWGLEVGPPHRKGETDAEYAAVDGVSWGAVYIHKFVGPDPGQDMHDHPWWMLSRILKGAYTEIVCEDPRRLLSGTTVAKAHVWRAGSWHRMPRGWAHQIVEITGSPCWTAMFRGPKRTDWGFFTPQGWVDRHTYETTIRAERRDLMAEPIGGGM